MAAEDEAPAPCPKENFLRQFRNSTNHEFTDISANQFLQIWDHYDNDGANFANCLRK